VLQVYEDVKYGMVDDIDIWKFPYWKPLLGCQDQFMVMDRRSICCLENLLFGCVKKILVVGRVLIWNGFMVMY